MSAELDGFLQETRLRFSQVLASECFDREDKETFRKILELATKVCKVPRKAICKVFKTTEATVSRWVTGDASPGLFTRKSVIIWLTQNLQEPLETVPAV